MSLPPSRRRWRRRREVQPSGDVRTISELLPYRAWRDDDVEHGRYACSVQTGPFELILGHAPTLELAKQHADAAERGDGS